MTITQIKHLNKGDIFKLGPNVWDALHRFEAIHYYDDKNNKWVNVSNKNTRSCIWLSSAFSGKNDGGFAWWDENAVAYLPKFPISPFKKTLGSPFMPHSNGQFHFAFPYKLNEINIEHPSLMNSEQNVQVSDTTDDASSTDDDKQTGSQTKTK